MLESNFSVQFQILLRKLPTVQFWKLTVHTNQESKEWPSQLDNHRIMWREWRGQQCQAASTPWVTVSRVAGCPTSAMATPVRLRYTEARAWSLATVCPPSPPTSSPPVTTPCRAAWRWAPVPARAVVTPPPARTAGGAAASPRPAWRGPTPARPSGCPTCPAPSPRCAPPRPAYRTGQYTPPARFSRALIQNFL